MRADAVGHLSRSLPELAVPLLLGGLTVVSLGVSALLLGPLYLAAVSGDLVRIDVESRRLPNRIVLPGYPVVLAGIALHGVITGTSPALALGAGAAELGFFLLLTLGGGMGMGDVKLAGLLGLCLGSLGLVSALAGLAIAFGLGAVAGLVVLARRVGGLNTQLPFGPFLLAGFWVAVAITPALATSAS